jgi:hypothetical protein
MSETLPPLPRGLNGRGRWLIVAAVLTLCIGATAGYNLTQHVQLMTTTRLAQAVAEIQQGRADRIGKLESRLSYTEERVQKTESRQEHLERTVAELRAELNRLAPGKR